MNVNVCDFDELEDIIASSNSSVEVSPPRAKTPAELDNSVEKMQTSKVETVKSTTVTENKESATLETAAQSGAWSVDSIQEHKDNTESAETEQTYDTLESPPLSISEEILEPEILSLPESSTGSPPPIKNDLKCEETSKSPKLRRTLSKIDLILNSTPDELDNIEIGPPPIRNSPRPNSRPVTPRPLKPPKPSILVQSTHQIQDKPAEPVKTPNSLEESTATSATDDVEQMVDRVEKVDLEIEEEERDDNKEPVKVMCKCCYIFNCRLIDTRCRTA